MERNKTVSVVIPAYNAAPRIEKCLDALFLQSFKPFEIIVVDDGSTDNTIQIAQRYAIVIHNDQKKGAGGARNAGAYICQGDILAFIDSDCVPPLDWLKNLMAVFSDETVAAAGGGYSNGSGAHFWQSFLCQELAFRRRKRTRKVKTLVANNFACRRPLFSEAGGFPEEYPVCEDMLLSYRLSQKGSVVWLPHNGVQHHFKNSLRAFLKHQYFFGAESTRFFLQNPQMLFVEHHQGTSLHRAIMAAFFLAASFLISIAAFFFGLYSVSRACFIVAITALAAHYLLYRAFLRHLRSVKLPHVAGAYAVSLVRDIVCVVSFFDGVLRAFFRRKAKGK